jgi:hypothetical protein
MCKECRLSCLNPATEINPPTLKPTFIPDIPLGELLAFGFLKHLSSKDI